MLQLYKNIKKQRQLLGMTQTDLAKKMGYADKSMIAKIEKGVVDLPQSKIIAFAEVLKTTPSNLMGWENNLEKKVQEFKPYTIETLKKIISSNPELAYKSLATVCMNKRVQLDWTEKKVANLANVDLNDYLDFENNHYRLNINDVENILNTLDLSISFVLGFMCAILSIENNKTNLFDL